MSWDIEEQTELNTTREELAISIKKDIEYYERKLKESQLHLRIIEDT